MIREIKVIYNAELYLAELNDPKSSAKKPLCKANAEGVYICHIQMTLSMSYFDGWRR